METFEDSFVQELQQRNSIFIVSWSEQGTVEEVLRKFLGSN
jgi:hypothetical protein